MWRPISKEDNKDILESLSKEEMDGILLADKHPDSDYQPLRTIYKTMSSLVSDNIAYIDKSVTDLRPVSRRTEHSEPAHIPVEAIRAPKRTQQRIECEQLKDRLEHQKEAYAVVLDDLTERNGILHQENERLKQQMSELQAKLKESEEARERSTRDFQTANDNLETKTKEADERIRAQTQQIDFVSAELEAAKNTIQKLEKELKFIDKLTRDHERKNRKIEREKDASIIHDLRDEIAFLKSKIKTDQNTIQQEKNHAEKTGKNLETAVAKIKWQDSWIEHLLAVGEELEKEKAERQKDASIIHDRNIELAFLKGKAKTDKQARQEAKDRADEVTKKLEAVTKENDYLKKKLESGQSSASGAADTLSKEFQVVKAERDNIKERNRELSRRLEEEENDKRKLVERLAELRDERTTEEEVLSLPWYKKLQFQIASLQEAVRYREKHLLRAQELEQERRISEEALRRDNARYAELNTRLEQKLQLLTQLSGVGLRLDINSGGSGSPGTEASVVIPFQLILRLRE